MERYDKEGLSNLLPWPETDANKYSRGKLYLCAGSSTYPGAACLAACASQRAGAGYTEVIAAPRAVPVIQVYKPSLVVRSWDGISEEELQPTASGKPCAYVVGPGFDATKKNATALTYFILGKAKAPVLVDGGALSSLSSTAGRALLKNRFVEGYPTVITPHAGEAARLAKSFGHPLDDPAHLAYLLSLSYGVVTVLKGPETYISDGEEIFAVTQGTPALAKAGTGDVLSGIIGAFLSQGVEPLDAAVLGASLHASAGCIAAAELTEICVTAEDVIDYLPKAIRNLKARDTESAAPAEAETTEE